MTARKIYRLILLILANLLFLAGASFVNLFLVANERARARASAFCTMLWSRSMCLILGIRIIRSGINNTLSGFAVCNHISYLDILVIGSVSPLSFLAKSEVKGWPLFGWLATIGGTIFIKRELKKSAIGVMQEIERKIDHGVMVIIFPEGTTTDGRSIGRFKSTFFSVPARKNIPVMPVSIMYPEELLGAVAWYGGMTLAPHFWNLLGIRRIDAALHFNQPVSRPAEEISVVEARKHLCALAYESVAAGAGVRRSC